MDNRPIISYMNEVSQPATKMSRSSQAMQSVLGLKRSTQLERFSNGSFRLITGYSSLFAIPTEKNDYVLIDSGLDPEARLIKHFLAGQGLDIKQSIRAVIHTHVHEDHVQGDKSLGEDVPIVLHPEGLPKLKGGQLSDGFLPKLKDVCTVALNRNPGSYLGDMNYQTVNYGEEILYPGLEITILGTPGHTAESIAIAANKHLYVGDSLDFSRTGQVRESFRPLTMNHQMAARSIVKLVTQVEDLGLSLEQNNSVHPAHSGSGDWPMVLAYSLS